MTSIDLFPPLPTKKSQRSKTKTASRRGKNSEPSKKEYEQQAKKAVKLEKFIEESLRNAENEKERQRLKKLELEAKAAAYLAKKKTQGIIPSDAFEATPANIQEDIVKNKPVVFEPFPKQVEYLQADDDHVLAGGGRASGKSASFIFEPLQWVENKNFRGLFIRRNLVDLRDLIRRCQDLYKTLIPSVQWKVKENVFVFPSGATIEYGHLDSEQDVEKYRGQEYCFIGIDEISQIPEYEWVSRLLGSLRSSDPNQKVYFRATTNWTGVGIDWVKEYWHVDTHPQGKTIAEKSVIKLPDGNTKEVILTKKWFNSTIFDNPKMANDAQYLAFLDSQPEHLKRAWLYGETTSIEGIAFPDFDKNYHVVEPFDVPSRWVRYTGCDYGRGDGAANVWIAVDPSTQNTYVYREVVANMRQHKEKLSAAEFAVKCLEAEKDDEFIRWRIIDGSLWDKRGSAEPSLYEEMKREGFLARPADKGKGSRVAGKNKIHELLRKTEGVPKLFVFNTCPTLIKMFGSIPLDKHNAEDVDTDHPSDHCFDSETEILTDSGWKLFKDLDRTEKVATLSPEGTVVYQKPYRYIEKDYTGEMWEYESYGLNFRTTPEHNFCHIPQYTHKIKKEKTWGLTTLKDLPNTAYIPRTGEWSGHTSKTINIAGKTCDTNAFFWFLGMWLAEGCYNNTHNHHYIKVSQKTHKDKIEANLNTLPWKYNKTTDKNGVTDYCISNKELFKWFQDVGLIPTHSWDKFIPKDILTFDKEHLEYLYEGMMWGDGCWSQMHYSTASKQLSDDFQELLLKIGKVGRQVKYDYQHNHSGLCRPQYRIYIRKGHSSDLIKKNIKKTRVTEKVYCVTVPEYSTLYVRRKGVPMWCGNCYDALRYVLMSRPSSRPKLVGDNKPITYSWSKR